MDPIERARLSLDGLSVGDAFGDCFFDAFDVIEPMIRQRNAREPVALDRYARGGRRVWAYTDDTNMALSIVECLERFGRIDQDWLAADFARKFETFRGYGPAMIGYLANLRNGADWRRESRALFGGEGSLGNGAAMRIAPLGGFFADDIERAAEEAANSAEVTHAHPEGIAGAVAVAVAAALAWQALGQTTEPAEFIEQVIPYVADTRVGYGLERAARLPKDSSVNLAVSALGNGSRITAMDTVPFCIWCSANWLHDYEEAIWQSVSGLGDRDTTCAIVGGIVALSAGSQSIPQAWLDTREPLPI